jgi:hypothetical protein
MDIEFMLSLHNAGFHFHQLKKIQNFPFILKIAYKNEKKFPLARQYLVTELEKRCLNQLVARMEPAQAMTVLAFTLGTGEELEERALQICARFTSQVLESKAFLAANWKALQMMFKMEFFSESVKEMDFFKAVFF